MILYQNWRGDFYNRGIVWGIIVADIRVCEA